MSTHTTQRVIILSDAAMKALGAMRYADGIVAVWNRILAECGQPAINDPARTESVRPGDYALPKAQTLALLEAWTSQETADVRVPIHMHWCNVGPSSTEEG
jgi:hypothetical protein